MVDTREVQGRVVPIIWTRKKLDEFKKIYQKNVDEKNAEFEFETHRILTSYAKYLIEYMETQFKTGANNDHRV